MDSCKISLVIPTVSRPTLARTLASIRRQPWHADDEVVLIGDGPQPAAESLWDQFGLPGRYIELPERHNDWGHGPRNCIFPFLRGDYVAALDDDDEWSPDALATIRKGIAEDPGKPILFRMDGLPCKGTKWAVREIVEGNVGTPMFVHPRELPPGPQPLYAPRHGGDCDYIRDVVALFNGEVVWREEVIALIRPWN